MFIDIDRSTLYIFNRISKSVIIFKMGIPIISSEESKSLDYTFNPKPSALVNYLKSSVITSTAVISLKYHFIHIGPNVSNDA